MPRLPVAIALQPPLPPLPTAPYPAPSPLDTHISTTLSSTDYDTACVPLTNPRWQERWERLCLRPVEEELDPTSQAAMTRDLEREVVDREADVWRKEGGLRRNELNVSRLEETRGLIAVAAEWLEMDSSDEGIRFDSELALRAELSQAIYLGVPTLILPAPQLANRAYLASYARAISNLLHLGGASAFTELSVRIPISDPTELINQGPGSPFGPPTSGPSTSATLPNGMSVPQSTSAGASSKHHKRISSLSTRPASMHQNSTTLAPNGMRNASGASAVSAASSTMSARSGAAPAPASGDPCSTWEMWDTIRSMCGYHSRLTVTLDLTNPLPPSVGALSRWTAEPVKHIWLPASSFISNGKGYPVLSKACQAFLKGMTKQSPTYILAGTQTNRHSAGGPSAYLQYVRHITSQAQSGMINPVNGQKSDEPAYTAGYADFLQAPLQPLFDDLGSATYDVFERDPVKYRQYEEATYLALLDLPAGGRYVITVVGAGRGPLVACALRALKRANRQAMVYAVEKNAAAYTTLQERKELEWFDTVQILYGDMRTVDVPEEADILVSELLGSFGDNELSPECLDGAMRFMKPSGISIPISYTAHLAPISSAKLHAEATSKARPASAPETPYVVMMSQVNVLSADGGGASGRCGERVQQCWQFEHPRRDLILDSSGAPLTNSHNTRSATLTFSIPHAGPCHGFAGYFEAHLYGNIGLSTHPDNAHRVSPDMYSWFPLFFPLRAPLYLPSGSEVEVHVWRLSEGRGRRVWYEWAAEAYLPGAGGSVGVGMGGGSGVGPGGGLSPGLGLGGPLGTPTGSLNGRPPLSPMMDATFSPVRNTFLGAGGAGFGEQGTGQGRVKIGQTGLHNAAGVHSWVGM